MTRVCLLGAEGVDVRYELLSRETAREALATYELHEPFENSLGVDTVSLGAAVSLLNDLDWYLARFVERALVLEPSIDDEEYLSRTLATAVRNGRVDPAETGEYLAVFGLVEDRPVEPLFVRRDGHRGGDGNDGGDGGADGGAGDSGTGGGTDDVPPYDLRDVEETVVVRVAEDEFGG